MMGAPGKRVLVLGDLVVFDVATSGVGFGCFISGVSINLSDLCPVAIVHKKLRENSSLDE